MIQYFCLECVRGGVIVSTGTIVTIVIVVLLIAGFVGLYFLGRKAQTRQEENQKMLDAAAQQFTILVIDKKKMKLTEAGFPANKKLSADNIIC